MMNEVSIEDSIRWAYSNKCYPAMILAREVKDLRRKVSRIQLIVCKLRDQQSKVKAQNYFREER